MMDEIVLTRDLWCRRGRNEALRGLSMSVPEGEVYALVGANGAGKTTALKVLMNLIAAGRGEARLLGVESRRLSPETLARIGYVSATHALPGRMRVEAYLRYLSHFYPTWDSQLEASLRARLQVPAREAIDRLSWGTRMKLALVAALSYRPRLLILDEPLAGLDPMARDEFITEVLQQAGDFTILITSHELGEIESMTSRVGFMHRGRMLLEESLSELTVRLRAVRVNLEQPRIAQPWPAEWLEPRTSGNVLTFIDTRHDPQTFGGRVGALLGPARDIQITPIDLRTLFPILERSAQAGVSP